MTLVVARSSVNGIFLISDTKLSGEDVTENSSILSGALKSIIVSKNLCVSFAGKSELARDALAPLFDGQITNREDVIEHLLEFHKINRREVDFIVAEADLQRPFFQIADGRCDRQGTSVAWIGDSDAFRAFQEASEKMSGANVHDADPFRSLQFVVGAQFKEVVNSGQFPGVGNFIVRVAFRAGSEGFRYLFEMEANDFHLGPSFGSFHRSSFRPDLAGIGAFGVHIFEARVGALFYPAKSWEPVIFRDIDDKAFVEKIRAEYRIALTGMYVSHDNQ